jgi:site-specific DNA recombinase
MVHKLDRFSRSIVDIHLMLDKLEALGVTFVSVSENIDMSTASGKAFLGMLAVFAQWYVDDLREKTTRGKRERAHAGVWNGTLTFGYTTLRRLRAQLLALGEGYRTGTVSESDYALKADLIELTLEEYAGTDDGLAIPCPFNTDGVRLAFSRYATGRYSDLEIAELMNESGYRTTGHHGSNPFSKDTVRDMLQNPFYLGKVSYKARHKAHRRNDEALLDGIHKAIIEVSLYERVQEVRQMRGKGTRVHSHKNKNSFPLSPILYCAHCHTRLAGWTLRGERRYRDPAREKGIACQQRSFPAAPIEAQVFELIQHMKLPDDWRERILAQSVDPTDMQRLQSLKLRLDRARKLYLSGELAEEEFSNLRTSLEQQIEPLEPRRPIDVEAMARLIDNLPLLWEKATPDERREWVQHLFRKAYVQEGRIVKIEANTALWRLFELFIGADGFRTRDLPRDRRIC